MKYSRFVRATAVALIGLLAFQGVAIAQSYDPDQSIPQPTLLELRMNKLGRGLANILFGWTEIPMTMHRKMKQGKPLQYLLTTAPVLGTARAVIRTGTGIYETFTFAGTRENVNYRPIIEPEYVF